MPKPETSSIPTLVPVSVPASALDDILALQLTVAWAGEAAGDPPRLGWWRTDLVDADGGGDLFKRLLPRTHAWAALESVLSAARRVDAEARRGLADADGLRTLYHLGFHVDEQLRERLAFHKRQGTPPHAALPALIDTEKSFSPDNLAEHLRAPSTAREARARLIPGGRQLPGAPPAAPELLVRHLAAALVPFAEQYPVPFYRAAP
jgi:hypothetical protein